MVNNHKHRVRTLQTTHTLCLVICYNWMDLFWCDCSLLTFVLSHHDACNHPGLWTARLSHIPCSRFLSIFSQVFKLDWLMFSVNNSNKLAIKGFMLVKKTLNSMTEYDLGGNEGYRLHHILLFIFLSSIFEFLFQKEWRRWKRNGQERKQRNRKPEVKKALMSFETYTDLPQLILVSAWKKLHIAYSDKGLTLGQYDKFRCKLAWSLWRRNIFITINSCIELWCRVQILYEPKDINPLNDLEVFLHRHGVRSIQWRDMINAMADLKKLLIRTNQEQQFLLVTRNECENLGMSGDLQDMRSASAFFVLFPRYFLAPHTSTQIMSAACAVWNLV